MEYVMGAIFIILFMLVNIILSFLGERLVIKAMFYNYKPIEAEIIGFDTVRYFKGGDKVTIVTYSVNGKKRDVIVLKSKADKIGEKIPIYTNGNVVVRAKYALTEYVSAGMIIMWFILLLGMLKYVTLHLEQVSIPILFMEIGIVILYFLSYPLMYEIHNRGIQERWRGY